MDWIRLIKAIGISIPVFAQIGIIIGLLVRKMMFQKFLQ